MERYSNIFKLSGMALLTLVLFLAVMILAQNLAQCNSQENDFTSQNQLLNTDHSSQDTNLPQHSLAACNDTDSDEDIIDYNDVHKVYRLFNTANIHVVNDFSEFELNRNELKSLNLFLSNSAQQEKTILLHSILI